MAACNLLAAQLQRAFDGGDPVARFRRQVAEQPQRDLHEGDGLDNQERHCPVPQPPRGKPDGAEQAGKQVEGRGKARAGSDTVELALIIVRAGAHEAFHLGAAFSG
jgi:hypothetical protein